MHDVPDRNFGGHQADKGSGHGGDGRGGADLALSGRAAHLQGNDSILTLHISVQLNPNHQLTHMTVETTGAHRDSRQGYIYFFL